MTFEENLKKMEQIDVYCDKQTEIYGHDDCKQCLIKEECDACGGSFNDEPAILDRAFDKIHDETVDHPSHYNHGMECIDEMILIFGEEVVAHFCLCNAWKYRYRALDKGGREDIDKSHWYMAKFKELTEWKKSRDSMITLP